MPRIYISHRPEDSSRNKVRLIRERLIAEFGANNVLSSTDGATASTLQIQRMVQSCDVLLVVIGRYWLNMVDERGNRLLDDPIDPIHAELSAGLQTLMGINILTVDGAPVPEQDDLSEALHNLTDKPHITADDDDHLHQVLNTLIQAWQNIPTGTMAEENGIDLATLGTSRRQAHRQDRIAYEQKRTQRRIEQSQSGYKFDKSRSGMLILTALVTISLLAGITLFARILLVGIDLPFSPNAQTPAQSLTLDPVASFDISASTIGFTVPHDYLYIAERKNGERLSYYVDPQNPNQTVNPDTQSEFVLQGQVELTAGKKAGIGAEVGNRNIVFAQVDEDDSTIVAVSGMLDVYVVSADLLAPQLAYNADHYKGKIWDDIFHYHPVSNLLVILYGEKEVRIMSITEDSIDDYGTIKLPDIIGHVSQISLNATGDYLVARSNVQVVLYKIRR